MTRRELLSGALGAALLAGCSDIRSRRLDGMDPRAPALLAGTISVDIHSHAAGAGNARARRFDLADHMRRGRLSAVCLCHSADGPVIRRPAAGGRIRQYRDPSAGELYAHTQRRLAFMDGLVSQHGMTRVLTPADLAAANAAGRPALIGTIEGCQFMDGRLERVQEVYDRGIRHLQIVHYMPSDLGDQQTEDAKWGGLACGRAASRSWMGGTGSPAVADLLLRQGFSPAEASKILGGNYARVFRQVAAARRAARGARTLARR